MYQSMFGAGSGPTAFATDMLIMEDINNQDYECTWGGRGLMPCEETAMDCASCDYYERKPI